MNTSEQITEDMKTSMKAGEAERTGVLRLLRSAFKNEEIKQGAPLDEAGVIKVLTREAKQRRDSIAAYETAGRQDLADTEQAELAIIQTYLPEAMTESELEGVVDKVIAEVGATSMAQMGQVIGAVMKEVGAKAEGGAVSAMVKRRLAQ